MKKFFLIAAASLALGACSNSEDVIPAADANAPIAFKGITKKTARGGLDLTVLTDGTNIYCSGLLHGTEGSSFHFNNELFTSAGSNQWGASNAKWPMDGTLDFWAYTCSDYIRTVTSPGVQTTTTQNNVTPATATFNTAANNYSALTLDFQDRLQGSTDVMVSDVVTAECSKRPVPMLTFKHTMSWILVNVTSTSATGADNDLMKIYSITLDNVKLSGSLSIDAATFTPSWTPFRSVGATEDDVVAHKLFPAYGQDTDATSVLLGDAKLAAMEGIMVIPQPQTSITINYSLKGGDGTFGARLQHVIHLDELVGGVKKYDDWVAGNKYVYIINFDVVGNDITITSKVTPFEDTTENNPDYQTTI